MDATPELVTNVRFDERKRGYDPEQVDNYLQQLSEKVAQLRSMAREAVERAEAAEAAAAESRRSATDPEAEATKAAGVLSMAQKTADATVAEAEESAARTLAEARAKAEETVSEAEAAAARTRAESRRELDASRAEQLGRLRDEIGELEAHRDALRRDADRLERFLDDERSRLGDLVERVGHLLRQPEGLSLADPPELQAPDAAPSVGQDHLGEPSSETDTPDAHDAGDGAAAPPVDDAPAPPADDAAAPWQPTAPAPDAPTSDAPASDAPASDAAPSDPPRSTGGEPASPEAPSPRADDPSFWGEGDDAPEAGSGKAVMEMVRARAVASGHRQPEEATEPVAADADEPGEPDEGPATQAVPVAALFDDDIDVATGRRREDSPLGEPDDESDAAMRAFFESDLDEADEKAKGWFRRH